MNSKKELSKTEWSLMNICWKKGKTTARDIYDASLKEKQRSYQSVKTMLDRLAQKGFLQREKFGPLWLYEPAVTRASIRTAAIENFVDTVLERSFAPLLVHFSSQEKLKPEEIQALKKLINQHKQE